MRPKRPMAFKMKKWSLGPFQLFSEFFEARDQNNVTKGGKEKEVSDPSIQLTQSFSMIGTNEDAFGEAENW
jgi:hypothetical protein